MIRKNRLHAPKAARVLTGVALSAGALMIALLSTGANANADVAHGPFGHALPANTTSALLATPSVAAMSSSDQASVVHGAYLARAGDCIACHTAAHGTPFAGGLPIVSPLGTIYSTNITPDNDHGIGHYTEAQFGAALREGKRADGANLYPAMPYPSYTKLTDRDVHDLYLYFMKGVAPSATQPPVTQLSFPFNLRIALSVWNWVFTQPGVFQPDPNASVEVNRGAYLVQGLGHCGSCHTARGIGMQEEALDGVGRNGDDYLKGANLNAWWAPQLRAGAGNAGGVASWTPDEIVDYLRTGRNAHTSVNGEMQSVVEHSLSHLSDADLNAMAAYLKTLPVNASTMTPPVDEHARQSTQHTLTAATGLTLGQRLYLDNCAGCHTVTGNGAPRVFPATAGNSLINAKNPTGLITTILRGAVTPSTPLSPEHLPMPGFAYRLSDDEVAQLATFVRAGWGNRGDAVSAKEVADVRAKLTAQK